MSVLTTQWPTIDSAKLQTFVTAQCTPIKPAQCETFDATKLSTKQAAVGPTLGSAVWSTDNPACAYSDIKAFVPAVEPAICET